MSGGGAGPIIINSIAASVSETDRAELNSIADRSQVRCSRIDALRVLRILWKYLRP